MAKMIMAKSHSRILLLVSTLILAGLAGPPVLADKLDDARKLLKTTEIDEKFNLAAQSQTGDIIRTYASIVAMTTNVELTDSIKQQIISCYEQTYTWENFESGFVRIFAETFSELELNLLIDFFSDKSVSPTNIAQFKNLRDKAEIIEQETIEFMFTNSIGCDSRNVELIQAFVANATS